MLFMAALLAKYSETFLYTFCFTVPQGRKGEPIETRPGERTKSCSGLASPANLVQFDKGLNMMGGQQGVNLFFKAFALDDQQHFHGSPPWTGANSQ
jgi:hypothetical protein